MRYVGLALVVGGWLVGIAACGGGSAPPAEPGKQVPLSEPSLEPAEPEPGPQASAEPAEPAASAAAPSASASATAPEPEPPPPEGPKFTEGMSVDQAINAVPQGGSRINLDPETLGKPLQNMEIYAPCKLRDTDKFKLRVAVYDGRAVGVDVITKNKKLAECVAREVRKLTWADKVPSLNTVEFQF